MHYALCCSLLRFVYLNYKCGTIKLFDSEIFLHVTWPPERVRHRRFDMDILIHLSIFHPLKALFL